MNDAHYSVTARDAVASLAQACPGGPGHRGGPRALCVACLLTTVERAYNIGYREGSSCLAGLAGGR